jgi:deoxyadenosine/deoxycytidine kinase
MRISIEGPVGCGKTSLIELLSKLKYKTYPISKDDNIWIKSYISNPEKFALGYNIYTLFEHINKEYGNDKLYIYENSPFTIKYVWAKTMLKKNYLTQIEYRLQLDMVDKLGWAPDCIIYLDCPPQVCYQRVKDNIDISLKEIEDLSLEYEKAIDLPECGIPVYKVNADDDVINIFYHVVQILCQVAKYNSL